MENVPLPLIVKNKLTLNKWLSRCMNNSLYDNGYIMLILSNYLKLWIDSNVDLERFIDDDRYHDNFNDFIYKEYVKPLENYIFDYDEDELYEHYNSMYSDEIIDIFIYFKDFTKSLNSQLFHLKDDTSYPLSQFIYSVCDYKSPYNDDNELSEEEAPEILEEEELD